MRSFCDGLLCFILKMVNFSLTQWLDPSGIGHAASSPRRSFAVPPWRRCARGRPGCLLDVWAKRRPSCHGTCQMKIAGLNKKKTHTHTYMYIYIYIMELWWLISGLSLFITLNWGLKGLKWIHDVCDGITTPWSCPGFRSDQLRSAPSCGWADISPLSDGGTTYIQSWLSQRFILCDQTWRHMTDDCRLFSQLLENRWKS